MIGRVLRWVDEGVLPDARQFLEELHELVTWWREVFEDRA